MEEKKPKEEERKLSVEEIVEVISQMNAMELSELAKALEDKFGVSAQMPVAVAPASAGVTPAEEKKEEAPSEVSVILVEAGANRLNVIREVRSITGLGLKEAKELVDNAPRPVKESISVEDANKIKEQLEKAGAKVEVK